MNACFLEHSAERSRTFITWTTGLSSLSLASKYCMHWITRCTFLIVQPYEERSVWEHKRVNSPALYSLQGSDTHRVARPRNTITPRSFFPIGPRVGVRRARVRVFAYVRAHRWVIELRESKISTGSWPRQACGCGRMFTALEHGLSLWLSSTLLCPDMSVHRCIVFPLCRSFEVHFVCMCGRLMKLSALFASLSFNSAALCNAGLECLGSSRCANFTCRRQ